MDRTGKVISSLREDKGWSQRELAKAAGVSNSTISRVESGLVEADIGTLRRIAHALGYSNSNEFLIMVHKLNYAADAATDVMKGRVVYDNANKESEQIGPLDNDHATTAHSVPESQIPEDKITIFSRNARKLSPEEWEQLQSVARALFKKVFDEDESE